MGKVIELVQDTQAWLDYRKARIGASDVPIILGESPYKTAYDLWCEKTNKKEASPMNQAMARGKRLEPIAREMVQREYEMPFPATVMQHETKDYFMASLDGWNIKNNIIWECKTCPRHEHNSLHVNGVMDRYKSQVQAQLLISQADIALFTTIASIMRHGEEVYEIQTIEVVADQERFAIINDAVDAFWNCIQTNTPPPMTTNDYEERTDIGWQIVADDYRAALNNKEQADLALELARGRLIKMMRTDKQRGRGVSANRHLQDGRIDYKLIPELKNIDLTQYRSKPKEIVTIRVMEGVN